MKKIKNILKVILVFTLIAIMVYSFNMTHEQNYAGSYSSATVCTERSREYILKEFGDSESIERLLLDIDEFACKNFTYVKKGWYIQHFDIDEFIFEDKLHGLCFDFACFTKIVVLEVAKYKGWDDVKVYVCDADIPNKRNGHSFNFITQGKNTYYIDTTSDSTHYQNGEKVTGPLRLGKISRKNFVKKLGMKFSNYH